MKAGRAGSRILSKTVILKISFVLVKNNCHKVHRGDDKAFSEAFCRSSYLAKERGKRYGSLGTDNYSGSRVRSLY